MIWCMKCLTKGNEFLIWTSTYENHDNYILKDDVERRKENYFDSEKEKYAGKI